MNVLLSFLLTLLMEATIFQRYGIASLWYGMYFYNFSMIWKYLEIYSVIVHEVY